MRKLVLNVEWDDEAKVYVATIDDVPGLVVEAATLDAVKDKVLALVPVFMEENAHLLPIDSDPSDGMGELVRLCIESSFIVESARVH